MESSFLVLYSFYHKKIKGAVLSLLFYKTLYFVLYTFPFISAKQIKRKRLTIKTIISNTPLPILQSTQKEIALHTYPGCPLASEQMLSLAQWLPYYA